MISVHLEPVTVDVTIARWFEDERSAQECFESYSPYIAVATLITRGNGVEICGLHGTITRPMREALARALQEAGVTRAFATRRGRHIEWTEKGVRL